MCSFLTLLPNPSRLWISGSHPSSTSCAPAWCEAVPDPCLTTGCPSPSALLLPSLSPGSLPPGCSIGESVPGAAGTHGKSTSHRHSKVCQNLAPGHRSVCAGRLSAPQPASWQGFFCVLVVSPKILVLPYFGFILNSSLTRPKFYHILFCPLRATGMNGAWKAHTKCRNKCSASLSKELLLFVDH